MGFTVTIGEHSVIPYPSRITPEGHFSRKRANTSSPHFSAQTKAYFNDTRASEVFPERIILRNVGVAETILAWV